MKYLIIFAIVMIGFWLWRSSRSSGDSGGRTKPDATGSNRAGKPLTPLPPATEIVACDVCHVHLPKSEALTGPGGVYCSVAHRRQAGK